MSYSSISGIPRTFSTISVRRASIFVGKMAMLEMRWKGDCFFGKRQHVLVKLPDELFATIQVGVLRIEILVEDQREASAILSDVCRCT